MRSTHRPQTFLVTIELSFATLVPRSIGTHFRINASPEYHTRSSRSSSTHGSTQTAGAEHTCQMMHSQPDVHATHSLRKKSVVTFVLQQLHLRSVTAGRWAIARSIVIAF
jgi:hypothetical protein